MLFNPHDAHWIPAGLPGGGHVLLFNNGMAKSEQDFSSADEIELPLLPDGTYLLEDGKPFGPADLTWTFEDPGRLFSPRISGAQRLPNGHTLICSGTQHMLLEVTPDAKIVWMYRNPPRFHNPPSAAEPSLADLPEEQQDKVRIDGGIPLEDGGTLFRAVKYPPNYPAFQGRDLSPKLDD